MGTHFIVDAHTTPIGSSPINDIRFSPAGDTSPMNGNFVIRVDDSLAVQVENITNLNDLLTEKYAELLASYPGFSSIIYDDMMDATGVDLTTSFGVLTGDRGSIAFAPTDGSFGPPPELRSVMVPLGSTPTQAIVAWELFEVTHSDPIAGRTVRSYVESVPDPGVNFSADVSFNNYSTSIVVSDGTLINIAPVDQGNQLVMSFTVTGVLPGRRYVGSWAVIF